MFNFEKLEVWQKAIDFADLVNRTARNFPEDERFGLTTLPFGNSAVPRGFFVPKGQRKNSPVFQRWEHDQKVVSPAGTADPNAKCKVKNAEFRPSLRDSSRSASIPSLEKAGLLSFVPPGHKAPNYSSSTPHLTINHQLPRYQLLRP